MKKFALDASQLRDIATGHGGCVATDRITVDGLPVLHMVRDFPNNDMDSGWSFFSGTEDEAYRNDQANLAVYDVNTIANFDPSIVPYLDAPFGSESGRKTSTPPSPPSTTSNAHVPHLRVEPACPR